MWPLSGCQRLRPRAGHLPDGFQLSPGLSISPSYFSFFRAHSSPIHYFPSPFSSHNFALLILSNRSGAGWRTSGWVVSSRRWMTLPASKGPSQSRCRPASAISWPPPKVPCSPTSPTLMIRIRGEQQQMSVLGRLKWEVAVHHLFKLLRLFSF